MVLAKRDGWVFPVLYCLLASKSLATYERLFNLIHVMWPAFNPSSVSMDFEEAAQLAIKNVYPNIEIRGCFFHLVRNMHKHLAKVHDGQQNLYTQYKNDPDFALR